MKDHVYKYIEVVGTSSESIEKAIETALSKASSTVDEIRWFQVIEVRGSVDNGKVDHYQVVIKIGFALKETV